MGVAEIELQLGVGDEVGEAVAAEQEAVARLHRKLLRLHIHIALKAERAHDDVRHRGCREPCLRIAAKAKEEVREAVVRRDLRNPAAAQQVGAAVASVTDGNGIARELHAHNRRPHPLSRPDLERRLVDGPVGHQHRLLEQLGRLTYARSRREGNALQPLRALVEVGDRLDADLRGNLPGGMTAHAIGDDIEPVGRHHDEVVFVLVSHKTNVAPDRETKRQLRCLDVSILVQRQWQPMRLRRVRQEEGLGSRKELPARANRNIGVQLRARRAACGILYPLLAADGLRQTVLRAAVA